MYTIVKGDDELPAAIVVADRDLRYTIVIASEWATASTIQEALELVRYSNDGLVRLIAPVKLWDELLSVGWRASTDVVMMEWRPA